MVSWRDGDERRPQLQTYRHIEVGLWACGIPSELATIRPQPQLIVPTIPLVSGYPTAQPSRRVPGLRGNDSTRSSRTSSERTDYDPTASAESFTGSAVTGSFARVVVITTTLVRTNSVPRIVRRPSASPPRKYPSNTATTGFTYA